MNLPEYRAAVRAAHVKFAAEVNEAAERLEKALMVADREFFEEPEKSVERDPEETRGYRM